MHTLNIHFDSRNYLYQRALASQTSTNGNLAEARQFSLPNLDRQFFWNAKGKPIFFSDKLSQARIKLFKDLVSKGENIVVLNANTQKWQELPRYATLGFGIKQQTEAGQLAYKELVDEQTSLIYVATIGDDLSVPDFQKVIRFAHDRGIVVVVDNTAGAEGILFDPITWGADYVMSNLLYWHSDLKTPGHVVVRTSSLVIGDSWGNQSPYNEHKSGEGRVIPLPTASFWQENPNEVARIKEKLAVTLHLAKWLQALPQTEEVVYPGLPKHPDHFDALKFFRNGFGNQLIWAPASETNIIDLLQKQFVGVPVPGVKITPTTDSKAFKIEVRNGNLKEITDAMQRALALSGNASGFRRLEDQQARLHSEQIRSSIENETIQKLTSSDF
ncbi:PLP-dependent transferase [Pontibacter sp. 13R65]|uniref:PLP-dependent transferase n=1 Tax=Pontibacter sp. 13R65 TaxID=3127458 RepID=UPI00301BCA07